MIDYPQEFAEVLWYRADFGPVLRRNYDTLDSAEVADPDAALDFVGDPIVRRYSVWQLIGVQPGAVAGTAYQVTILGTSKGESVIPAIFTITPNLATLSSDSYSQVIDSTFPYTFDFTLPLQDVGDTLASATISVPAGIVAVGTPEVRRRTVAQELQIPDTTAAGQYLVTCTAVSKSGQTVVLRLKIVAIVS